MRLLHWAKRLNDDGLMADEDWVKLSHREKEQYEDYLVRRGAGIVTKRTLKAAGDAACYGLGMILGLFIRLDK